LRFGERWRVGGRDGRLQLRQKLDRVAGGQRVGDGLIRYAEKRYGEELGVAARSIFLVLRERLARSARREAFGLSLFVVAVARELVDPHDEAAIVDWPTALFVMPSVGCRSNLARSDRKYPPSRCQCR
jgi:hypothetical protein